MNHVYFVILAGGNGERLWPLSSEERPKQLIPFLSSKSLLEQTIDRVSSLVEDEQQILVVTNKKQEELVSKAVGGKVGQILSEPCLRNTGPAILWVACQIAKKDPEGVMVVLPSDHFIPDTEKFEGLLEKAVDYAKNNNKIVTFGLKPRYPATGYGYIQAAGDSLTNDSASECFSVAKFHEKPAKDVANLYVQRNDMFWNIGIFTAQVKMFLREYEYLAFELFDRMQKYFVGEIDYNDLPNISIDYAVMEKSDDVVVFSADFDWYDVGDINTFLTLELQYSNKIQPIISVESSGNLASSNSGKLVAFVGINDLCVVETDDVILVMSKEKAGLVKNAIPKAKNIFKESVA